MLRPLPSLRAAMRRGVTRKVDKLATVRIGSARYSVPHTLRGQRVDVSTVDDRIEIWHQDLRVAQHRLVPPGGTSILDEYYDRPARKPQRAGSRGPARWRSGSGAGTSRMVEAGQVSVTWKSSSSGGSGAHVGHDLDEPKWGRRGQVLDNSGAEPARG